MSSVVVGMFDTQAAAEQARKQLLSAGFAAAAVSLTGGSSGATSSSVSTGSESSSSHQGGAISRFFDDLFGGSDDTTSRDGYADTYREAFNRGSYGVSVTAASESELDRAEEILNAAGAVDIDERAQSWRQEGWTGGSAGVAAQGAGTTLEAGATRKLQEVEEELKVGKRAVARGGVRIFNRVTEVPIEESVTLREEHANVQRRAVDRPATEADFAAFKEGSIEVRETAEEAVVSKTARVVGEVEIGKTATEREEVVRDTVRKSSVEVEQIGGSSSNGTVERTSALTDSGTTTRGTTTSGGSANRDPLSGELGSHPVGTGVGAAAGGVAAGAAAGSVAGPVGTVVGAAVGAVAGGLAGKGVAETVDPTDKPKRK